jgi:hypothetical protein
MGDDFGHLTGDVVGYRDHPILAAAVLRLCYVPLSPRRRSRRYLFLYRGHLSATADPLRCTGAGGLAFGGGRGPRETSVYDRCLGSVAGSPSLLMDIAVG